MTNKDPLYLAAAVGTFVLMLHVYKKMTEDQEESGGLSGDFQDLDKKSDEEDEKEENNEDGGLSDDFQEL